MKTLLILRHAKSSWKNSELSDHDRPLNGRGKRDAPRMGKVLAKEDLVPDLIISSTAKRARKTAKEVALACDYDGEIEKNSNLYHASPRTYISVLQTVADDYEQVMVVGHNPGLEDLVDLLTDTPEIMPTAALAHVSLPINSWSELTGDTEGELINIWRPKELRRW